MNNERFAGSELLFSPSDIGQWVTGPQAWLIKPGLKQSGLSQTIADVIAAMPEELRGMFWANIGIFGGLGDIETLGERLCVLLSAFASSLTSRREQDLRALCPVDHEIGIFEAFEYVHLFTSLSILAS